MIHPLQRLAKGASGAGVSAVPSDWLSLPSRIEDEEKCAALVAVFPSGGNFLSLKFEGAYTVDWGDGTVENFDSNTQADHVYDSASLSSATECSRGYRQAVAVITPQTLNQLTSVNFGVRYGSLIGNSSSPILSLSLNIPNCTSLNVAGTAGGTVYHSLLERLSIGQIGPVLNLAYLLQYCGAIHDLSWFDTSACQNFSGMLWNCQGLSSLPLLNTSSGINFSGMFGQCYKLINIPLLDTSSGTDFSYFAMSSCSLKSIPALDFSQGTVFTSAFLGTGRISECLAEGATRSISFPGCTLSAAAIDTIFTNLGTAAGAQTVTVTGNPGAATCTPSIAEAKGWTVVTA